MFDFLSMQGNYAERKVSRYEKNGLTVDTCAVTDSDKPFETAIQHKKYNDNKWIIVELYSTKAKSKIGHKKWVKQMTNKKLPFELKDVSTATIAKLAFGNKKVNLICKKK